MDKFYNRVDVSRVTFYVRGREGLDFISKL